MGAAGSIVSGTDFSRLTPQNVADMLLAEAPACAAQYRDAIIDNGINGAYIKSIGDDEQLLRLLRDLGVTNSAHLLKLSTSVKELKKILDALVSAAGVADEVRTRAASQVATKDPSTDVFLSHNWGADGANHTIVSAVNKSLMLRGFRTWFDEDQLRGNLREEMTRGIEHTKSALVFVTSEYRNKVNQPSRRDNCKWEFMHMLDQLDDTKMLPVVMEADMRQNREWKGVLGGALGGKLYTDISNVAIGSDTWEARMDKIADLLRAVIAEGAVGGESAAAASPPASMSSSDPDPADAPAPAVLAAAVPAPTLAVTVAVAVPMPEAHKVPESLLPQLEANIMPQQPPYRPFLFLSQLTGHRGRVSCLVELKSNRICSGSSDRSVKVWNTVTGVCEKTLEGHEASVLCLVRLGLRGKICSGAEDGVIKIWNEDTGACEATFCAHFEEGGGGESVQCLVELASHDLCSCGDDNMIKIWTLPASGMATGDALPPHRTLAGHEHYVRIAAEVGGKLYSCDYQGFIKVWNIKTGTAETTMRPVSLENTYIRAISLLHNDLMCTAENRVLRVWNQHLQPVLELTGHRANIFSVLQLKNKRLASASGDHTIKVFSLDGRLEQTIERHTSTVRCVIQLKLSGKLCACADDKTITIFGPGGQKEIK